MDGIGEARPSVWSAAFTSPDEMAAAQRDARIEYQSLADRANYAGRLSVIDLGSLRFQTAEDGAHVVRGEIAPGRTAILFPMGRVAPGLKVNGWGGWDEAGILLRSRAEMLSVTPMPQAWSAVVVCEDTFGALLDRPHLPPSTGFAGLPHLLRDAPGLMRLAHDLRAVAWTDPARVSAGSVPAALMDELSCYLGRVGARIEAEADARLRLGRRVRLVSNAEEYLGTKLGKAIYTSEVAAAIGVSERTLSAAFTAIYGISVQRYLLLRRLNQVNRALQSPQDASARLVKTAALDYGFWNLGRFARAYRTLFGETPSLTVLRRAGNDKIKRML